MWGTKGNERKETERESLNEKKKYQEKPPSALFLFGIVRPRVELETRIAKAIEQILF